jgi:hypothetical protein
MRYTDLPPWRGTFGTEQLRKRVFNRGSSAPFRARPLDLHCDLLGRVNESCSKSKARAEPKGRRRPMRPAGTLVPTAKAAGALKLNQRGRGEALLAPVERRDCWLLRSRRTTRPRSRSSNSGTRSGRLSDRRRGGLKRCERLTSVVSTNVHGERVDRSVRLAEAPVCVCTAGYGQRGQASSGFAPSASVTAVSNTDGRSRLRAPS